jgi:hypothetical protein
MVDLKEMGYEAWRRMKLAQDHVVRKYNFGQEFKYKC